MKKRNTLLLIAAVIIVSSIVLVFSGIKKQKQNEELVYFANLAKTAEAFYEEQASDVGIDRNQYNLTKNCHHSGQGPFDDGHLRCDLNVNINNDISVSDASINEMLSKLEQTLKKQSFIVVGGAPKLFEGRPGASFSAGIYDDDTRPCTVHISYSPIRDEGVRTFSYRLTCGKEASRQIPGYSYTPLR